MKVEIYGSAESQTVRGATVNFNADSAAPVTEFVAEVNPNGFDGRTGVDIDNNGTTQSVAFGKTCYGGSANVTTGTLTEEYGGGAYDPQNVPAEVESEVESKLTLETATPGDIVSFDCELGEYPINSLSFPLAPIQDLHGYDSPWPAGGGKNKFDYDTAYASFKKSDGTFRGTASQIIKIHYNIPSELIGSQVTFSTFLDLTDSGTLTWIRCQARVSESWVYGNRILNGANGYSSVTFTPTSTEDYVTLEYGSNGESQYTFYDIQLEVGSSRTTFSPYSNICPISGRDGVDVTRTGKNLLPQTNHATKLFTVADDGTISQNNPSSASFSWNYANSIMRVTLPAGTYTLTETLLTDVTNTNHGVHVYTDSDVLVASVVFGAQTAGEYSKTFTFTKTTSIGIVVKLYSATAKLSIVQGLSPSSYEPYTGNTYAVDWTTEAGTVYGGNATYLGGGNWRLTVTMAEVDLGTLDWTYQSSQNRFYAKCLGALMPTNGNVLASLVCSQYRLIEFDTLVVGQDNAVVAGVQTTDPYITIRDTAYTDAASFKSAMSGVQLVYELATPLTYTLTAEQLTTLLGQNNVWCDAGEISELKYYDGDIADTDIQTENGVLVTGDKLFYALSSPRTSSFTPTSVNAVQGENTMSANTGDIAVTYTANWHDITPWIAWQGISFSRNDVDAPDAGRDMSGLMHRGRVAVKEKININTIPLTRAQSAELQTLLYPETYQVRITPYPRTNAQQVLSVYSNNVKTSYVIHRESGEDLQTVSFPMIEN